jgi:hypothetical protein
MSSNIQINNGSVIATAIPSAPQQGNNVFQIGRRADASTYGGRPNKPFNGVIDEVVLWNRVLTDTERVALYNKGTGCGYPFTACP